MERLFKSVPDSRRLFRTDDVFTSCDNPLVIACQRRRRRARWVLVAVVLAGLWGFGMAGQMAAEPPLPVSAAAQQDANAG